MSSSTSQKKAVMPEEVLSQLAKEKDASLNEGDLRLLTSGYKALKEQGGKSLNQREIMSIYSLFAYVAHNQNVTQETVQEVLLARYGVKTLEEIRASQYMDAVEFLVDLEMNKVMN